jgi:NADP-reducing hydrogenase subunit HndB
MPKITVQDLNTIREKAVKKNSLRYEKGKVRVTVHMGDCGIAAGARDVMTSLMNEWNRTDRDDIRVLAAGCTGECSTEPNVTVEADGESPVVYQKVSPDKMERIFRHHVLMGEIQKDMILAGN